MSEASALRLARSFLDRMEERDLDAARALLGPEFLAIYPGDRRFRSLEELVASGGRRYRGVRKRHAEAFYVPAGDDGQETVIFSGTLYGSFADGEAFEGIRFTDRFRIRNGRIVEQQVWNDIGEALLARAGREG
jgi:hypothetical protein